MTADEFGRQYPFHVERPVEWADMDAFQHVNNTVYFRYFEKIRIDYFADKGLIAAMTEQNIGPILASTRCRFRLPLTHPDTILIGTFITDLQADRFLMNYGIYSLAHQRLAAEGDGFIVCYDYQRGEKAPIPAAIFARLEADALNASSR